MADLLRGAGFVERARTRRAPDQDGDFPERTPQGYLLARKHLLTEPGVGYRFEP